MSENKSAFDIVWNGSATSLPIDIFTNGSPMALVVPASFTATSLTLQAAIRDINGTYFNVKNESNSAITITVDGTAAGWYDLTSIFPASVRYVKFVASSSITNTATLVTRDVV